MILITAYWVSRPAVLKYSCEQPYVWNISTLRDLMKKRKCTVIHKLHFDEMIPMKIKFPAIRKRLFRKSHVK